MASTWLSSIEQPSESVWMIMCGATFWLLFTITNHQIIQRYPKINVVLYPWKWYVVVSRVHLHFLGHDPQLKEFRAIIKEKQNSNSIGKVLVFMDGAMNFSDSTRPLKDLTIHNRSNWALSPDYSGLIYWQKTTYFWPKTSRKRWLWRSCTLCSLQVRTFCVSRCIWARSKMKRTDVPTHLVHFFWLSCFFSERFNCPGP